MELDEAAREFQEFVSVIQALRTPVTGCPWDLEQDHRTLRRYLIEEAYEVLDAIERADDAALQEELGDVLLQVVLHAQVAADRSAFAIPAVVRGIKEKMIRRHPHVFGDVRVASSDEVKQHWERIKATEKAGQAVEKSPRVPESLPALLRAQKLGEVAPQPSGDLPGVREAFAALEVALRDTHEGTQARLEWCIGELFFALAQLARQHGVDAEASLRAANQRFERTASATHESSS
ncbi:MAG: nucleoside triphosphate pyrophosphohydrolase [Planctomycetia bacterium]|nr:nucleoside triphosphate pyrophosphohydrolase [Planctomycetia bacterium]